MRGRIARFLVVVAAAAAVVAFFRLGLGEQLRFETLRAHHAEWQETFRRSPVPFLSLYLVGYVLMAALSLPGATIMTIAGGALFGLATGSVVVSFASTIGATLAMLIARYLFRDAVRARFGERLRRMDEGIAREGGFYLLTLRLVPIFPFFVINIAMGLTSIRARTFYLASQLGMLPATVVYVNAGTQLASISSPGDVASPRVLASLAALGLLPLVLKAVIGPLRSWHALRRFDRPRRFDHDVVVLGAGSGGLVAAHVAATARAKVALVERGRMGGDCLNTGCVPSKALLSTAKLVARARHAGTWGLEDTEIPVDFARVMDRVGAVVKAIEPHDSVERYTRLGVACVHGQARIVDPYRVRVGERTLTTRTIVVATGAEPLVPPIPGLDEVRYLTSDTLWDLRELPRRLVVVGGGPVGCEMAQAFARLGSEVTQVEMLPRILAVEDEDASALVEARFREEGIRVLTGHRLARFGRDGEGQHLLAERVGDGPTETVRVELDAVLLALGRKARVSGFGLEELGVALDDRGRVVTDASLRTSVPNVFACGDVTGPLQLTHAASHQAAHAALNALLHPFWSLRADMTVMPWATFTDPEVARVGLNEQEAQEKGIDHEVTRYDVADLDRAIADGRAEGFLKVLTPPGRDRILGATMVAAHAGDLIQELAVAMKHGIGLKRLLGTVHPYPTWTEANRMAAGRWRQQHAPERLLRWAARFHAWRRGGR